MAIKVTSIRIEEDLIDKVKFLALKEKTTQTELINEFIKNGLKEKGEL